MKTFLTSRQRKAKTSVVWGQKQFSDSALGRGSHQCRVTNRFPTRVVVPGVFADASQGGKKPRVKVTFSYSPENEDELRLEIGDIITVIKQVKTHENLLQIYNHPQWSRTRFVRHPSLSEKVSRPVLKLVPQTKHRKRPLPNFFSLELKSPPPANTLLQGGGCTIVIAV